MRTATWLILILLAPAMTSLAQNDETLEERNPQAREKLRAAHAAYITERIGLTSAESEKFWPIYREYSEKRRELRKKMWETRRSGAHDQQALNRDLELKQAELDLEKEYTEKFSKVIPVEKVIKLRDAEADFRKLLLKNIQRRRGGPGPRPH